MYIFNVTTNVAESIHDEWLHWMKEEYIPEMLATGKFTNALMSKVLVKESMGGITYSVQYQTKNKADLLDFYRQHAALVHKPSQKFKDEAVYFTTEMEIVHQQ